MSRSTPPAAALATLAIALLLAGCGSDSSGGTATDPASAEPLTLEQLRGHAYEAGPQDVESPAHELVAGTTIRISFEGGTINARAGCNHLFGEVSLADGRLEVDGLGGTEMGCPEDRAAQDAWLTDFLDAGPAAELTDDTLTLTAGEERITFSGVPVPEPGSGGDPDEPTSHQG